MNAIKTSAILAAEVEAKGFRGNQLVADCLDTIRALETQVADAANLRSQVNSLQGDLQQAQRQPRRPVWVVPVVVALAAATIIVAITLVLEYRKMGDYQTHIQQLESMAEQQKAAIAAANQTAQQFLSSFDKLTQVTVDSLNATAASRQAQIEARLEAQKYADAIQALGAKQQTTTAKPPAN